MAIKHTIRLADGTFKKFDNYTKTKAIKEFCRHCVGGNISECKNCTTTWCANYPYRPGSKVKTRIISEENREKAKERFKNYRESKNAV